MSELSELFERDPLSLTTEDISTIIKRMREARANYELGVKSPVAERKTKTKGDDLLAKLGLSDFKDLG